MDAQKPRKLTKRRQIYVDEYLKCFNSSEAARRAGYSGKNTDSIAAQVAKDPIVKEAIKKRLEESHMSADEALKLLAEMARGEQPTKRIVSADGSASETYDKLDALDKIVRVHGRYRDNLDMTTGGQPLTVKVIKGVSMDDI